MLKTFQLAFQTSDLSADDMQLLINNVDLAIVTAASTARHANAAGTKAAITDYRIVTQLPVYNVIDWLAYARQNSLDPELGFFHVSSAYTFNPALTGFSADGYPVRWWADAQRITALGVRTNLFDHFDANDLLYPHPTWFTDNAHTVAMGAATNDAIFWGYQDPFATIDFVVTTPAVGWTGVWKYPRLVDSDGVPTGYGTLSLVADTTNGLTQSGQIRFVPPSDWVPALLAVGGTGSFVTASYPLAPPTYPIGGYYVKLQTTAPGSQAPAVSSARAQDYTGQGDTYTSITIPAWDAAADLDGDGYLNDAEYATRASGKDARFQYQSRMATYGGANVLWANYTNPAMQAWLADYLVRSAQFSDWADGFFLDNSGVTTLTGVIETGNYPQGFAQALTRALEAMPPSDSGPRFVVLNTGTAGGSGYLAGFLQLRETNLRTNGTWKTFEQVASLASTGPSIIDAYDPSTDSPSDRDKMAMLAAYYCLAKTTDYLGVFSVNTTTGPWTPNKWFAAVGVDLGTPLAAKTLFASGVDPSDSGKTYRIYSRRYTLGTAYYKPLSAASDGTPGTNADNTATTHELLNTLAADGTQTASGKQITLRNGEGLVLFNR